MENCVIYIKLFILAVASLITGVSTISRKWYINFFVFLLCIIVETCLAYLFFRHMCFIRHVLPWSYSSCHGYGNGANRKAPEKTITRSGSPCNREYRKTIWNFIITIPIS